MWRWLVRILVISLLLMLALVLVVWAEGRHVPAWYQPPDATSAQVASTADGLEMRMMEQTHRIRPDDETWPLSLSEEAMNAWLATRLRAWIAHEQGVEWPEHLGTPQVHVGDDVVSLALPVGAEPDRRRVIVARVAPVLDDAGLTLRLETLQLGRLSLPGDPMEALLGLLEEHGLSEDDAITPGRLVSLLTGTEPLEPVLELGDGRRVELTELSCRAGVIDLKGRTLGRGATERRSD